MSLLRLSGKGTVTRKPICAEISLSCSISNGCNRPTAECSNFWILLYAIIHTLPHIPVVTIFTSSAHPFCHTFNVSSPHHIEACKALNMSDFLHEFNACISSPLASYSPSQCSLGDSFRDVYTCNLASNCSYCHDAFRSQPARTCLTFVTSVHV